MGVHNGEAFLSETLASIAAQTFQDYEFVIVDDASCDGTAALLAQAAERDQRIRVFTNDSNMGLTWSLNRGLDEARGDYIARIDADDICLPDRLAVQHAHMERHRDEVGITSGFNVIDGDGDHVRSSDEELDDWQVRWLLGWNPPAPHPTFFFRRKPDGKTPIRYDEEFKTAQDFDLWSRLSAIGPTRRLPDILIQYRRHDGAITHAKRQEQAQNCAIIGRRNLAERLPGSVARKLEPLIAMFSYNLKADRGSIQTVIAAADEMTAIDCADAPSAQHRQWVRKMTAGLLADAILSRAGGLSSPSAMAAFLWFGRGHLPHLARAVLSDPGTALKSLRARNR